MALAAASVVEVRTAGNDTNGGGFVTGASGSNYSTADAKRTGTGVNDSTTDAVANGTTTITSATAAFTTAIIGNIIYLAGGTGGLAAGWYQVLTRPSATSITVDRNVAAGNTITMNIGGALASPGMSGGYGLVGGGRVWIKAGTYSITSATINISGGCPSYGVLVMIEGYENSRGDRGVAPVLQASGIATATLFTLGTNDSACVNVDVDGATLTAIRGFSCTVRNSFLFCTAANCTNSGFNLTSASTFAAYCRATGCTTTGAGFVGIAGGSFYGCVADQNSVPGFSGSGVYQQCIAAENSGATTDGFITAATHSQYFYCVSYGNGRDGFRTNTTDFRCMWCIAEGNSAGVGFIVSAGTGAGCYLFNCAGQSNSSNTSGTFLLGNTDFNTGAGSSSFFNDAAAGDFTLNNNTGDGASVQQIPEIFPYGGTGYPSLGALAPQVFARGIRLVGRGGITAGA